MMTMTLIILVDSTEDCACVGVDNNNDEGLGNGDIRHNSDKGGLSENNCDDDELQIR